ncbi:hypothetical protein [Pseudomonas sp. CF161]|uniref:hypothetical protein n=1 Tax=Pseudomonas sp. CF161 TaxID=911241 RepID=UPI0003550C48|nr:hypothetical protein [Pseudomonas sp. CF161]EPL06269.1 hypothetical protein CF161_20124 [Pseudomonas sp. CF161]
MTSERPSLMLLQRVAKHADATLHCREISLQLAADSQHLILTRYNERYSPEGMEWVERRHRVSITDLMRWVIEHGQALELEQSSEPRRVSA